MSNTTLNVHNQQLLALNTPSGATTVRELKKFQSINYLLAHDLINLFKVIGEITEDNYSKERNEKISSLARVGQQMIDEKLFDQLEEFFTGLSIVPQNSDSKANLKII